MSAKWQHSTFNTQGSSVILCGFFVKKNTVLTQFKGKGLLDFSGSLLT
jgi:hypothetical protein